ncbi:MAG: glycosyltransferase family 39 protein [Candidatus Aenigmatarchaeota archaeon]
MKNEYKTVFVLFLIALVIRILFVFISPVKIWDETVYANLGYDLSKNPFDYSFANNGWSDFVPGGWPKAGFRAPLLPYTLSIFYFFKLDFLIDFLIPLIGALSVIITFFLAKNMFNEKIAFYSAAFLSFLPLHVYYSGKILTDVFSSFFVILTVIFFWYGFERNVTKFKVLFGIILALSILARYTNLWLIPIFPIYLIFKNRNLSFMKDKWVWLTICIFFAILSPWFIYGIITYNSPLGAFEHALKASSYWGGTQPWYFFFENSFQMFSILSIVFAASLLYIIFNKKTRKDQKIIFLLLWFFMIFVFASIMPHKEDRFFMSLTPPFVIISALFINNIVKYQKFVFGLIIILLILSCSSLFVIVSQNSYSQVNICFLESNLFLKSVENNSVVITDESPIIYYYSKKETHFYPRPFSINSIRNLIDKNYNDRPVYILFSEYDMPLDRPENMKIKTILDSNFEIVYKCSENKNLSIIYKYR